MEESNKMGTERHPLGIISILRKSGLGGAEGTQGNLGWLLKKVGEGSRNFVQMTLSRSLFGKILQKWCWTEYGVKNGSGIDGRYQNISVCLNSQYVRK